MSELKSPPPNPPGSAQESSDQPRTRDPRPTPPPTPPAPPPGDLQTQNVSAARQAANLGAPQLPHTDASRVRRALPRPRPQARGSHVDVSYQNRASLPNPEPDSASRRAPSPELNPHIRRRADGQPVPTPQLPRPRPRPHPLPPELTAEGKPDVSYVNRAAIHVTGQRTPTLPKIDPTRLPSRRTRRANLAPGSIEPALPLPPAPAPPASEVPQVGGEVPQDPQARDLPPLANQPPISSSHLDQTRPLPDREKPAPTQSSTPKQYLYALMGGLGLAPLALALLTLGSDKLVEAPIAISSPLVAGGSPAFLLIVGFLQLILAGGLFLALAYIAATQSTLALGLGALWPLALTVFSGVIYRWVNPADILQLSIEPLHRRFFHALTSTTATGLYPTVAIVMMAGAATAPLAFEAGRKTALHELAETEPLTPGHKPQAPASRLIDHILAAVAAIICVAGGLLCLIPLHERLAKLGVAQTGQEPSLVLQVGLPLIGIALLFIATVSGVRSALGLPVAGILICVLPGILLTVTMLLDPHDAAAIIGKITSLFGTSMRIAGGPLTAAGLVMVTVGLAAFWSRHAGYREQLAL